MPRADISENLVHFTRGDDVDGAFQRLRAILRDGHLLAGTRFIRGGHACICFSEAPLQALEAGLVNPDFYTRYSPFGIMVSKRWLYARGGRPVIYQAEGEYDILPAAQSWRHVTYEPLRDPPIDFTWEREWRIRVDTLAFGPEAAAVVVQDQHWVDRLVQEHELEQDVEVQQYSLLFDGQLARLMVERPFRWRIVKLR